MPKTKIEKIQLTNIHIALWNPRHEQIAKLSFDFKSKMSERDNNYDDEKELEAIIKLFSQQDESDSSGDNKYNKSGNKFEELFDSILVKFWKNDERIHLIENNDKKGQYIVVEGNRRISCLKILQNIDKYLDKFNSMDNLNSNEKDFFNFLKKYKNKMKDKDIKQELSNNEFEIHIDNTKIFSLLFVKHNSGERIGFRSWGKWKHYLDVYLIFKNEEWYSQKDLDKEEDIIKESFSKIPQKLYDDYKKHVELFRFLVINQKVMKK